MPEQATSVSNPSEDSFPPATMAVDRFQIILESLRTLAKDTVLGDFWNLAINDHFHAQRSEALTLQILFELTHVASFNKLRSSTNNLNEIELILGKDLPKEEQSLRELLDIFRLPFTSEILDSCLALRTFIDQYTSWRHCMNEGPLAVGYQIVLQFVETHPGFFITQEQKQNRNKILDLRNTFTVPTWTDGTSVDFAEWQPDFKLYLRGTTFHLVNKRDPNLLALFNPDDWTYSLGKRVE